MRIGIVFFLLFNFIFMFSKVSVADGLNDLTVYIQDKTYYDIISEAAEAVLPDTDQKFFLHTLQRFSFDGKGDWTKLSIFEYEKFKNLCTTVQKHRAREFQTTADGARLVDPYGFTLNYGISVALRNAKKANNNYLQPKLLTSRPMSALIVGGINEMCISEGYEQCTGDIAKSINRNGPSIVLYGNGSSTHRLVSGDDPMTTRDSAGHVVTERIQIASNLSATKDNVNRLFQLIKESKTKDLFLYWGGHGGKSGISLWRDYLTFQELERLKEPLYEVGTMIRSVYDHCYAGSMLVSGNRKVPQSFSELSQYFENYYPYNSCGLAVSTENEVSWSPTSYHPGNSDWRHVFYDHASLSRVRDRLWFLTSSPRLTSDYFFDDLLSWYCQSRPLSSDSDSQCDQKNGSLLIGEISIPKVPVVDNLDSLCEDPLKNEINQLEENYLRYEKLSNEMYRVEKYWKEEYLKQHHNKILDSYSAAIKEIGASETKLAIKKETPEIRQRIAFLQRTSIAPYEKLSHSLSKLPLSKELENFMDDFEVSWFKSKASDYPNFLKFFEENKYSEKTKVKLFSLKDKISEEEKNIQKSRQELEKKWFDKRKALLEAWLDGPEMKKIKARYQSVVDCETLPVDRSPDLSKPLD